MVRITTRQTPLRLVAVVVRMGEAQHPTMTEEQAKPKAEEQEPEELSEDDVEEVSGGIKKIVSQSPEFIPII